MASSLWSGIPSMLILLLSDPLRSKEIPHFLKLLLCSDSLPASFYPPNWSEEIACLMQPVCLQYKTANFVFEVEGLNGVMAFTAIG